jgi:NAD+ kinase
MLVAIYNRVFDFDHIPCIQKLFHELSKRDFKTILHKGFVDQLTNVIPLPEGAGIFHSYDDLPAETDFFISLGGDGTILDSVCFVGNKNIPILGINLGTLGFLAGTSTNEVEFAIDCLEKDKYTKDIRTLLHLDSNKQIFDNNHFALNDFSIQRKDSSALVKIHTYLNGEFLCTYWADGLIVSTPTGSTGYNLSCGGPIIAPQTNSFVITPVAPHNLNVRPMVIPNDTVVSFEVEGRAKEYLCTLDARTSTIDSSFSIGIRKEDFTVTLLRLDGQNFLGTIRNKLYWGMDKRN